MITKQPTMQPITKAGKQAANTMRKALLMAIIPATLASTSLLAQQQPLSDAAVAAQKENNTSVAAAQENIGKMVEQAQDLSQQYASALEALDSLDKYNDQLQKQVDAQSTEKTSLQTQLTEIETTTREVLPLMERMVATLDQFVKADIPFLLEERTGRVNTLLELMGRADVAISEKYRRILEAYQIELEFGSTLEAYKGAMGAGADARTVQFVRLGRVSLMYQTEDGSETGYWDASAKQWVKAPEYAENIKAALAVARGDGAPDLLRVPVPAPQKVN
jgi:chromosome segregation ATPase